jgi:hypothetical protein
MNWTLADVGQLIERMGGWAVLCVFLWIGWRQFMTLATQFSAGVLSKLDGIKDALNAHERRLDKIDETLDEIQLYQQQHTVNKQVTSR